MSHITELEEIDRLQRQQEQQQPEEQQSTAFAKPMVEALDPHRQPSTPLLEQEEIEDQEPPRVNLTAVVCTAIVAVCATIILLVAKPWKDSDNTEFAANTTVVDEQSQQETVAEQQQPKAEPAKAEQPKTAEQQKPADAGACKKDRNI